MACGGDTRGEEPPTPQGGQDFSGLLPKTLIEDPVLSSGVPGWASIWTNLWIYFAHHHVRDTIVILEEGSCNYFRCPQCDMIVTQKSINVWHLTTTLCKRVMERKWCRLVEEEAKEGTERALSAYGVPFSQVTSFKYIRRFLSAEGNDWPAVVGNLRHTSQKWARLTRVLSREVADARKLGQI